MGMSTSVRNYRSTQAGSFITGFGTERIIWQCMVTEDLPMRDLSKGIS